MLFMTGNQAVVHSTRAKDHASTNTWNGLLPQQRTQRAAHGELRGSGAKHAVSAVCVPQPTPSREVRHHSSMLSMIRMMCYQVMV